MSVALPVVQNNSDGSLTIEYVPSKSGVHELNFTFSDKPILDMDGSLKLSYGASWSFFALLCLQIQGRIALQCYSCQYTTTPGNPGYECVNPANGSLATTINCTSSCLTSVQTTTATGELYFVRRGCHSSEANGCDGHPSLETCNIVCSDGDLCNVESCEPVPKSSTPSPPPSSSETSTVSTGTYFNCYSCVYSYSIGAETTCIYDPASVSPGTVRCPTTYVCTIFRQWAKGDDVIRSFSRSCQPKTSSTVTYCLEDTYFITYNTYCQTELCNSGNGVTTCPPYPPSPGGGGGGGGSVSKGSSTIRLEDAVAVRRTLMTLIVAIAARSVRLLVEIIN